MSTASRDGDLRMFARNVGITGDARRDAHFRYRARGWGLLPGISGSGFGNFRFITPRVQVPNNHILSKILTYITTIFKTEYLIIGSFGPLG